MVIVRTGRPMFAVLAILIGASGQAATVGYVNDPTTNSSDFTAGVSALGGTIDSNVDFDGHPVGALQNSFYTASDGVTFSTTGPINTVMSGAGPGQVNNSDNPNGTRPFSPGEGTHPASNFLFSDSALTSTLTLNFTLPVLGVGFFTIDLFSPPPLPPPSNPGLFNTMTIEAFTGSNGTGTSLGLFNNAQFNFQANHLYFMGLTSSNNDISSLVIRQVQLPGTGDQIGIDNILIARQGPQAVPEPSTIAMGWTSIFACLGYWWRTRRRSA
jgi:hypothetical protein